MRLPWAIVLVAVLGGGAGCADSEVSRELGARCDRKDECDERCAIGTAFPGGLCTSSCTANNECPVRAMCADEEGGVCLFVCATAEDCEFLGAGWTCRNVSDRAGGEGMACLGPE